MTKMINFFIIILVFTYSHAKVNFDTDYARENPATASNARSKFEELLKGEDMSKFSSC